MKLLLALLLMLHNTNYAVTVGYTTEGCNFTEPDGTECAYVEMLDGTGWIFEDTLEEEETYIVVVDTKGTKSIYDDVAIYWKLAKDMN